MDSGHNSLQHQGVRRPRASRHKHHEDDGQSLPSSLPPPRSRGSNHSRASSNTESSNPVRNNVVTGEVGLGRIKHQEQRANNRSEETRSLTPPPRTRNTSSSSSTMRKRDEDEAYSSLTANAKRINSTSTTSTTATDPWRQPVSASSTTSHDTTKTSNTSRTSSRFMQKMSDQQLKKQARPTVIPSEEPSLVKASSTRDRNSDNAIKDKARLTPSIIPNDDPSLQPSSGKRAAKSARAANVVEHDLESEKKDDKTTPTVPETTLRRNANGLESTPGAVRVRGVDATYNSDTFDQDSFAQEQPADMNQENRTIDNDKPEEDGDLHLINAVLVDEEQQATIRTDVPLAEASPLRPRRNKRLYCLLGLIAILIVVVVVVVVVVTGNNGGGGGGIDEEPEDVEDVTVVLQLDNVPEDTGWSLVCGTRTVNDIPATAYTGLNNRLLAINTRVGLQEECEFTIEDVAGDGIRDGFFQIYHGKEIIRVADRLLAQGSGDFGSIAKASVFVAAPLATPAPTVSFAPTVSPAPSGPLGTGNVLVEIQLDQFSAETGWNLACDGETLVDFPPRSFTNRSSLVSELVEVDIGIECTFVITDTFGDGILGDGFFRLTNDPSGTVVAEGNGDFGFEQQAVFVLEGERSLAPSKAPITVPPTVAPTLPPTLPPTVASTDRPSIAPSPWVAP